MKLFRKPALCLIFFLFACQPSLVNQITIIDDENIIPIHTSQRVPLLILAEAVGVLVFPHRPRHTYATRLLDAGCHVTSIQQFLGHKELSSTMVYARAHDQTVAEDYFAAMERVEQRLDISTSLTTVPTHSGSASIVPAKQKDMEVVKVQEPAKVLQLIEQLEVPELCFEERLDITLQLRELFGVVQELEPVMVMA